MNTLEDLEVVGIIGGSKWRTHKDCDCGEARQSNSFIVAQRNGSICVETWFVCGHKGYEEIGHTHPDNLSHILATYERTNKAMRDSLKWGEDFLSTIKDLKENLERTGYSGDSESRLAAFYLVGKLEKMVRGDPT